MIVELLLWAMIFVNWRTVDARNFLMIVVDDLRPALGCYGDPNAYTPNIDKLAESGVLFERAYAQQSLCAPSRNSLLTSRRPDTLELYDFYSYWRETVGNFTTLPQHLKNHGYRTKSIGKIFHPGKSSNFSDDSPYSWTDKPFHPQTNRYKNAPVCQSSSEFAPAENLICPVNVASMPGKTLPDLEILEAAKTFVKNQSGDRRPFFLAVGFEKPHIPLKYPQEYMKYHPLSKFRIADPYEWPENVSNVAYNPWTDLRRRDDVKRLNLKFPWEKIPVEFGEKIIQSYYAAVTYVDDLIGTLLDELRSSKFSKDTVVVLTSDHGWSLGEHAEWAKYSNFEVALRVPLIISIPQTGPRVTVTNVGRTGFLYPEIPEDTEEKAVEKISKKWLNERMEEKTKIIRLFELAELVDVFPTIAELAGFPVSLCSQKCDLCDESTPEILCSEGLSLMPVIVAAMENQRSSWKKGAFSQYPRPGLKPTLKPNSDKPRFSEITVMGYSLRTQKYRYTAWIRFSQKAKKADWSEILAEELYDHARDLDENSNAAHRPEYSQIRKKLRESLKCGWRKLLPVATKYQNFKEILQYSAQNFPHYR